MTARSVAPVFLGIKRDSDKREEFLKMANMWNETSCLRDNIRVRVCQCSAALDQMSRIREILSLRTGQFCTFRNMEWRGRRFQYSAKSSQESHPK